MRRACELKGRSAKTPIDTARKTQIIENNNRNDNLIELTSDMKLQKT
jgi:hypothetical protein